MQFRFYPVPGMVLPPICVWEILTLTFAWTTDKRTKEFRSDPQKTRHCWRKTSSRCHDTKCTFPKGLQSRSQVSVRAKLTLHPAPPVSPVFFASLINRSTCFSNIKGAILHFLQFFLSSCSLVAPSTDIFVYYGGFGTGRDDFCSLCTRYAVCSPTFGSIP